MTTVTNLPDELLDRILSSPSAEDPWLLYQLGHVCSKWRAIVSTSPRFWANVVANTWRFPTPLALPQSGQLKMYHRAITRSAPYPLTISLDLSKLASAADFPLTTLAPYAERLASLSLILGDDITNIRHLLSCGLENLEELSVMWLCSPPGWRNLSSTRISSELNQQCLPTILPRVKRLQVSGYLLGPWLAGSFLAHLHVTATSPNDRIQSWGLFLQVLEYCPLETLTVLDALPVFVEPYEHDLIWCWPKTSALQTLQRCVIQDHLKHISTFSMFLTAAALPPDTILDIAVTSLYSSEYRTSSDNLFSLTICRGDPHLARRVELDSSIRIYVGNKKQTELRLLKPNKINPYVSLNTKLLIEQLFLSKPLSSTPSTRTCVDVTELVLTLGDELMWYKGWTALLNCMPSLLRVHLRFSTLSSPFRPDQEAQDFHVQERAVAELLDCLAARTSTDDSCALSLLEELHIQGLCLGNWEAESLFHHIVSTFATRAKDGCPPLKVLKLDCVGTLPPLFELLSDTVGETVDCVAITV